MEKQQKLVLSVGMLMALALMLVAVQPLTAEPLFHATTSAPQQLNGECPVTAVGLIGAWVDAGANEGSFTFVSEDDEACTGDFATDVLPLFTTADIWFDGSEACTDCHFDNSEDSRHEMNLGSYDGLMTGGDVLSSPPGVAIIEPGDWENSKLRERLRNNRMPPGWEFDIEETNRDGPLLELDDGDVYAVDLIAAWVDAGAPETSFEWTDAEGDTHTGDFEEHVQPLFTEADAWFEGSEACTDCHFDNSEDSRHEMDMSSHAGMMLGGDVLSSPPGVAIIEPGDWDNSKLRARLRNNRMPPGWEFDIEETNRDGPVVMAGVKAQSTAVLQGDCDIYAVNLIGAWVDAGAVEGDFPFVSEDGKDCTGSFDTDVLPLFTTADIWFAGSEACTDCHFDNSEDSRHEMNVGSYAGLMLGGDVLSSPPGVAIIEPGDWENSKLRERLRNNRMPPGWEFDIEETNRDGPLLELDDGDVYAVDLIGAWVDAGAPETIFEWTDAEGDTHTGNFEEHVQPLFTEAGAWFEDSEACTDCHFDNSEDSRHEMDMSSHSGMMLGGDVLSSPPGVAIIEPGDWDNSKLRLRLRNNRMPPGWEFDIEETNRDGPLVQAGRLAAESGDDGAMEVVDTSTAVTPIEPQIPDPTITETVAQPELSPMFVGLFSGMTLIFGVGMLFVFGNQMRQPTAVGGQKVSGTNVFGFIFALVAVVASGLALHAVITDTFTQTITIHEEVPYAVEVPMDVPANSEVRVEEWQARIPEAYANLTNPFANDATAVAAGGALFHATDCYECHGEQLMGDGKFSAGLNPKPVNLTDPLLMDLPFMTDAYMFWRISEGGSQSPFFSAMPAWKQQLSENERWQIVTYIRSQTAETPVDEGEQAAIAIIEQSGCFACHRLEHLGRGGKIGPSWSELPEVAATRIEGVSAEEYVRQSIIEPNRFIVEGFEEASEMPSTFSETLTADEIDLLVDYLLGLPDD